MDGRCDEPRWRKLPAPSPCLAPGTLISSRLVCRSLLTVFMSLTRMLLQTSNAWQSCVMTQSYGARARPARSQRIGEGVPRASRASARGHAPGSPCRGPGSTRSA